MPALTMRGRYLMREYWSDSDLFLRLTADERELYQGLWMLADDAGWMPWDVAAIAAAVYHYEDRAPREAKVRAAVSKLVRIGKVRRDKCCLFLSAVSKYPRAGKQSTVHKAEHQKHSNGFDGRTRKGSAGFEAIQTDLNPSPVPSSPIPNVADARAPEGAASTDDWTPKIVAMQERGR